MCELASAFEMDRRDGRFVLHFTPAEWRAILADDGFLDGADNAYAAPRRLMGLEVAIVPDHRFG
ncbi:MAG TPA: hypothetical protein VHV27_09080 [Phenylobacterium sp.]|jgi:hypothetical protein|nr:hypothetical protein [Phenylobacterium sp.]